MNKTIIERLRYVSLPDQGGRYEPWSDLAREAADHFEARSALLDEAVATLKTIAEGEEVMRDGHTEIEDRKDAPEIAAAFLAFIDALEKGNG